MIEVTLSPSIKWGMMDVLEKLITMGGGMR